MAFDIPMRHKKLSGPPQADALKTCSPLENILGENENDRSVELYLNETLNSS
jgi:hypothetical protein